MTCWLPVGLPDLVLLLSTCAAGDRVFVYSGTLDTVVVPGVVHKAGEFYSLFVDRGGIASLFNVSSEHSMVTDDWGSPCDFLGSPWINNCQVSLASMFLTHLGLGSRPGVAWSMDDIITLKTADFTPPLLLPINVGMASKAYVYVPPVCKDAVSISRVRGVV